MANGFKTTIDRLAASTSIASTKQALLTFLAHLQARCEVPTAFERAAPAFYLPSDALELEAPPSWWLSLTSECWSDLLSDETDGPADDLSITCANPVLPVTRGMPAIVRSEVELLLSAGQAEEGTTPRRFSPAAPWKSRDLDTRRRCYDAPRYFPRAASAHQLATR